MDEVIQGFRDRRKKRLSQNLYEDEWTQEDYKKHPRSDRNGRFIEKGTTEEQLAMQHISENASIYGKITWMLRDTINSGIESTENESVKNAAIRALNDSVVSHSKSMFNGRRPSSVYNIDSNEVYLTRGVRTVSNRETPGDTAVHECFHWLDYNASGKKSIIPYSESYGGGKLRKTIHKEMKDYLSSLNIDLDSVKNADAVEIERMAMTISSDLQDRGFSVFDASDFSDMLHAVTKGKLSLGFGHFDKGYYSVSENTSREGVERNKSTEAFAEFGSAYTVNRGSQRILQSILPKSCGVFEEICESMNPSKSKGKKR